MAKAEKGAVYQFMNCRILWNHELIKEDFWVRDGVILNPEKLFFDERKSSDVQIDCQGGIIAPGYIDVQINGNQQFSSSISFICKQENVYTRQTLPSEELDV
mgnify:CR=1 FL=1